MTKFLMSTRCFRIAIDSETPEKAWADILDLAKEYSISPSKVAYIELAIRLKLPLASVDAEQIRVAKKAGVKHFAV